MTGVVLVANGCRGGGEGGGGGKRAKGEEEQQNQLSLIALLLATIRRSMVSCRVDRQDDVISAVHQMEIGWPTDVRHITHVTFDRFNGFLGLPVEFEVEIPGRVPSASEQLPCVCLCSASVFGVSPESMQCCYDPKGNSVPTILLLMQERLYTQGGLKAEGIFRINPENSQEEHVRDQLNKGIVPDDIDVHCLAGLIKAWFRELPAGVLDGLSPEQVLQCNTEEECVELVKLLLPMQAALLNWAVDLMTDVVEEEDVNKMNARNIAMVFAPNMTQMSDPLTALMHAVQVMNLLKTLILKTLREREEAAMEGYWPFSSSSSSDQQADDDFVSEIEHTSDDDHANYSQQEVDVSGELREPNSDDEHVSYSHSSGDEADSMKDIEDCFLRQLKWKEEAQDNNGGESISVFVCSGDQARQLSSSDFKIGFSISESKQGSSTTSDEEDSGENSSSIGDALTDTKSPSKQFENGKEVEMVQCLQNP